MLIEMQKMYLNPYYIVAIVKVDDFKHPDINDSKLKYAIRYDTTRQEPYWECFDNEEQRDKFYEERSKQVEHFFEVHK
jgi:hypothetical protein